MVEIKKGWALLDKVGDGTRSERMDYHKWIIIHAANGEDLIYCEIVESFDTYTHEYSIKCNPIRCDEIPIVAAEEL